MSDPARQGGLFASSRRLLATVLEIGQVRLEILSTEVELEKQRIFDGLLWGGAALLAIGVALVLACGFVLMIFWESYRLAATGLMAILFMTLGIVLARVAQQRLRNPESAIKTSLAELRSDLAELRAVNSNEPPDT